MNKITYTNFAVALILLLSASLMQNAVADKKPANSSFYDESAYPAQVEKDMDKLDALYLRYHDKSVSSGDAQKAKREYFRIARGIMHDMNERFDELDPKTGAALSQTDLLIINHVQIMLIDMLSSIHESAWLYGDEAY